MLKLLVDPSVFRYRRCGLTRYYGALCRGLAGRGVKLVIPLAGSGSDFQTPVTRITERLYRYKLPAKLLDKISRRAFQRLVRKGEFDCILLTSPDFDIDFLSFNAEAKFLMVAHDLMTCTSAPDGLYDAAGPGLMKLLSAAMRASHVVCISSDTRDALLAHGLVQPDRVSVVLTGNLLAEDNPSPHTPPLPDRYVLFVGERSGRKGFYRLVPILARIFRDDLTLNLVCTGELQPAEIVYLRHHGMESRTQAVVADDNTLVGLYENAECLLYPSLYEGFGLPVIEAMHFGCPVLTTHCGALKEVAGDAALIVDPSDEAAIERGIRSLTSDRSVRQRYISAGRTHAASFSTDTMMSEFYTRLVTLQQFSTSINKA